MDTKPLCRVVGNLGYVNYLLGLRALDTLVEGMQKRTEAEAASTEDEVKETRHLLKTAIK